MIPIKQDMIYVAGALNADSCGYIQNASRMTKHSNKIQRLGCATYNPANDFIQGLVDGGFEYHHYFRNSMEHLIRSDAMYVCPKSEMSEGVAQEKVIANNLGMPIFYDIKEIEEFMARPKILAIVGNSGSGKTTIAEYIERNYGIKMIESHTDRPKRFPDEIGHTFHTKESYDKLKKEDMIAWTEWNGTRYCCLKQDVLPANTYVIDEKGLQMMTTLYKYDYKVFSLKVERPYNDRVKDVGIERVERDNNKFWMPDKSFDYVLDNSGTLDDLEAEIDFIVESFFDETWRDEI